MFFYYSLLPTNPISSPYVYRHHLVSKRFQIQKLQAIQNSDLRVATGCAKMTSIGHLHEETTIFSYHAPFSLSCYHFLSCSHFLSYSHFVIMLPFPIMLPFHVMLSFRYHAPISYHATNISPELSNLGSSIVLSQKNE